MSTAALLRQNPLFAQLPDEEIAFLVQALHSRSLAAGEVLFHEGEQGEAFFIVVEGTAEILKSAGSADERLLGLGVPGSLIGEMALLGEDHRRTASIRARSAVRVLEMTSQEFEGLLHRRPELAFAIARMLTKRLHSSENATIRDLQEKNAQLQQAYDELQRAQAQIIEKEKLEKELAVARQLQMSILPKQLPRTRGFEITAATLPAKSVGGDFYDIIPLPQDRLGIAVADVSEKGVPAALFMTLTYSLLRAEAARSLDPVEVLQQVNRHLLGMNDAGMFVTVLYGVLDLHLRQFHYARAGHDQPLALSPAGQVLRLPLEEGQILGVIDTPALDRCSVPLPPGSTLLIFTDGVTECIDEHGGQFGSERLEAAVLSHQHEPARRLLSHLLDQLAAHRGAAAQNDDITLLVIQSMDE